MGEPEKAEKAYNSAKRRYVQEVGLLRKEIDDSDKKRLNAQQAQKHKTKMTERIQKVKKNWDLVQEKRDPYLDQNGVDDEDEEKWEKGREHSFLDEEYRKDKLIDDAEERIGRLEGKSEDDVVVYEPSSCSASGDETPREMDKIRQTLSDVTVSRQDLETFEKQLSEQLVNEWEENSQCKVFRGIEKDKFSDFLEVFQKSSGFDDEVKNAFLASSYGDGLTDNLKYFKCKLSDLEGKYGMYAVSLRQNEGGMSKLDVCYSIFTFKTTLLGTKTSRSKEFKNKFLTTQVEDVFTGEKRKHLTNNHRHMKVKDINALTQNFIVAKALSGFADAGVIPFVRYKEDIVPQLEQLGLVEPQGAQGAVVHEPAKDGDGEKVSTSIFYSV